MTSRVDETDSDHVPIASISPHPSPGASQSFFEETPPPPQPNIESHLEMRLQNPYDNVGLSNSTPMYSKPNREENKSRIQSEVSSVTSQKSNGSSFSYSFIYLSSLSFFLNVSFVSYVYKRLKVYLLTNKVSKYTQLNSLKMRNFEKA